MHNWIFLSTFAVKNLKRKMAKENSYSFKDVIKAWGKFFISTYFIKNFCIWLASIVLFFILVFVGLRIYTRHSQKVSVPSVEGMTLDEAKKIILERKLVPEITDSVFGGSSKPGTIIPNGQIPTAGYSVKEGRKVYLTYKAWTKELVDMPTVTNISLKDATRRIESCGLLLGKVTRKKAKFKDFVLEARFNGAKIPQGEGQPFKLHKGDVVDLVVSDGSEDQNSATDFSDEDSNSDSNFDKPDNGIDEF